MEETKKVDSGVRDRVNIWAATGLGLIIGALCVGVIWRAFEGVSSAPVGLRTSVAIGIGLLPVLGFTLIGMQVNKDHYKRRLERLFADIVIYADPQKHERPLLPERLSARISRYPNTEHTDDVSTWIIELVLLAENLAHERETVATNLDSIPERVVPEHENKTLPARVNHLIEAAEVWYNQAQKFEGEARELTQATLAAVALLTETTSSFWAKRGGRDPQSFALTPKQAAQQRRSAGAMAFRLLSLVYPQLNYSQFLEKFPDWELPLIVDVMTEAVARHLVSDNWPLCREVQRKLGDVFEDKLHQAMDRLEAEERRHGKDPKARLT